MKVACCITYSKGTYLHTWKAFIENKFSNITYFEHKEHYHELSVLKGMMCSNFMMVKHQFEELCLFDACIFINADMDIPLLIDNWDEPNDYVKLIIDNAPTWKLENNRHYANLSFIISYDTIKFSNICECYNLANELKQYIGNNDTDYEMQCEIFFYYLQMIFAKTMDIRQ